jgi:hypothetical protein
MEIERKMKMKKTRKQWAIKNSSGKYYLGLNTRGMANWQKIWDFGYIGFKTKEIAKLTLDIWELDGKVVPVWVSISVSEEDPEINKNK